MRKTLQAKSTLTDRYQTTIPEIVRESLHIGKRDKIAYTVQENGVVILSRAQEEDPVLACFLSFLAEDMSKNPNHIKPVSLALMKQAKKLVSGVQFDLDAPLDSSDD